MPDSDAEDYNGREVDPDYLVNLRKFMRRGLGAQLAIDKALRDVNSYVERVKRKDAESLMPPEDDLERGRR